MKVGVYGVGPWGRNHVRLLVELLGPRSVVACDPDAARLALVRSEHPGVKAAAELDAADLDAVVVASPAATHHRVAVEALRAGADVLVEKPLALAVPDAEQLVEVAHRAGRVLMVDHLLLYHPAIVALKRLVDDGRLGAVRHLRSQRLNLGVVRREENALWSLAPHDLSVVLHLLGEEPQTIAARGGAWLAPGHADVVDLSLGFPSGAHASVCVSWIDPVKTRRLVVVGERAMAVMDGVSEPSLLLHDARVRRRDDAWVVEREPAMTVPVDDTEPLRAAVQDFLRCIDRRATPVADGEDGLRTVRALAAAQRSLDNGGAPIAVRGSS